MIVKRFILQLGGSKSFVSVKRPRGVPEYIENSMRDATESPAASLSKYQSA